jgi:hypothetical protein
MDKYLIITKNLNGSYTIKDTITDIQATYYGYTLKQAEQKHRINMNIRYKHFTRIFL